MMAALEGQLTTKLYLLVRLGYVRLQFEGRGSGNTGQRIFFEAESCLKIVFRNLSLDLLTSLELVFVSDYDLKYALDVLPQPLVCCNVSGPYK